MTIAQSLIFNFHSFQLSSTQPFPLLLRLFFSSAFRRVLLTSTVLAFLPSRQTLLTPRICFFRLVSLPVLSFSSAREAESFPAYPRCSPWTPPGAEPVLSAYSCPQQSSLMRSSEEEKAFRGVSAGFLSYHYLSPLIVSGHL